MISSGHTKVPSDLGVIGHVHVRQLLPSDLAVHRRGLGRTYWRGSGGGSGGQGLSSRLLLALGLLAPHGVVLMDEPFDGFDLRQTREVVHLLRAEAAKGRSLVLAIHQLADAERVCDRFVLLSQGRLRGCGTLDDLRTRTGLGNAGLEEIFLALT